MLHNYYTNDGTPFELFKPNLPLPFVDVGEGQGAIGRDDIVTLLDAVSASYDTDEDIARIRRLLRWPVDVNGTTHYDGGYTPLLAALANANRNVGLTRTFQLVLALPGVDVNKPLNRDGRRLSALHVATKMGSARGLPYVNALLDAGADVNARNLSQKTPLFSATRNEQLELANLLLSRGADPTLTDNEGNTLEVPPTWRLINGRFIAVP
jgi:ankyrin repeat protein